MRVIVVGYGSMGRRRIRLLLRLVDYCEILCVDSSEKRREEILKDGYKCFSELQEAIKKGADVAFVCTSPGHHAEIILQLLEAKIHVFTELNLIDTEYSKIIALSKEKGKIVFMSSTMLYDKQIQEIDRQIKAVRKPVSYIYHVGQYLPDWHPWEDYRNFFIGKKETNGVKEIYAIQLPWIINTFGKIEYIKAVRNKCTDLDIDFEDSVITTFQHTNGNMGVFIADTVSRRAVTSLEVIGEDIHLFWNGCNDGLFFFNTEIGELCQINCYEKVEHREGYADNIIENRYIDEIQDFLNAVRGISLPMYSLEKDKYTLSIIKEIYGTK